MNVLCVIGLFFLLLLVSCFAVSQQLKKEEGENALMVEQDEAIDFDNVEHQRYKRAKKKGKKGKGKGKGKKGTTINKDLSGLVQVENCPKGTRLPRNCETCPIGFYSDKEGLWKDCLPCKVGETTLAEDATKCVEKCSAGTTWNRGDKTDCKKAANKKKARCKNCIKCEGNTYKSSDGNEPCRECPEYFKTNKDFTACFINCPAGYEPRDLPDGSRTCSPCRLGYVKPKSGGDDVMCTPCKEGTVTHTMGATNAKECIKDLSDKQCTSVYSLLDGVLQLVAYKTSDIDTLISAACQAYKSGLIDVCFLVSTLSNCTSVTNSKELPVYKDGTTAFSLADLLTADIPCIQWEDETDSGNMRSYGYSSSSSGMWFWPGYWSSGSSSSYYGSDGVWEDIANWLESSGTSTGKDDTGDFDMDDLFRSWFAKRDVHRRSLPGSGSNTGQVCKPNLEGDIPAAAKYDDIPVATEGGDIEQRKIGGGASKPAGSIMV